MRISSPTIQLALTLIATAAILAGTASVSRANFIICNRTTVGVLVEYKAPSDACDETGFKGDHILLSAGACEAVTQDSMRGQTAYYYALTQIGDREWRGGFGIWLPDAPGYFEGLCLPEITCKPSEGDLCGGGRVYSMRAVTSTARDRTINLIE